VAEPFTQAGEPSPRVVVGLLANPDLLAAGEAALALSAALRQAYPNLPSAAVVLSADPRGAGAPASPLPSGAEPPLVVAAGGSPAEALPALLELAAAQGSDACALLQAAPRPADPAWLRTLLDPLLHGGCDLVAPAYSRGRLDGVMVSGLVYPLTRALFGRRLRQPLGPELALSGRLGEQLLHEDGWRGAGGPGADLWAIALAEDPECRLAQVFLGPRPRVPAQPAGAAAALSRVLGLVFGEMERQAQRWMRVRGSLPVETFGEELPAEDLAPPPSPGPLVSAFALGWQDLRRLWSEVLPPRSLLALQRIPREPPEAFRMPDPLWVRVIYDFAVGWRVKAMDRAQLLRSMAPLYLGWLAGFVNEVSPLSPAEAEARVERLCAAFEEEKPYLISRWRWPDRFSP
jgi:glucosylglycerate synthase